LARQLRALALQESCDIVAEAALVVEGTRIAAQQAVAERRFLAVLRTLLQETQQH
jgi:hypothetical protein